MLLSFENFPVPGLLGDNFYSNYANLNTNKDEVIQTVQNNLESSLNTIFDTGIVFESYTGDLIQNPSALTVRIVPHKSVNGVAKNLTVNLDVAMPDDATRYLWEMQDVSDSNPSYQFTPTLTNPGDEANPAILLGEIVSNSGAITSITPMFNIVYPIGELGVVVDENSLLRSDDSKQLLSTTFDDTLDFNGSTGKLIANPGYYDARQNNFLGTGTDDNYDSFISLDSAIPVEGRKVLFPSGIYRVASNLTLEKKFGVWMGQGARIKPDNGVTVTLSESFEAGPYHVFDTSFEDDALVIVKSDVVRPEWWGAKGDGVSDDTDAFKSMFYSIQMAGGGTVVLLPGKNYKISLGTSSLSDKSICAFNGIDGLYIIGNGARIFTEDQYTFAEYSSGAAGWYFLTFENCKNVSMTGFTYEAKTNWPDTAKLGNPFIWMKDGNSNFNFDLNLVSLAYGVWAGTYAQQYKNINIDIKLKTYDVGYPVAVYGSDNVNILGYMERCRRNIYIAGSKNVMADVTVKDFHGPISALVTSNIPSGTTSATATVEYPSENVKVRVRDDGSTHSTPYEGGQTRRYLTGLSPSSDHGVGEFKNINIEIDLTQIDSTTPELSGIILGSLGLTAGEYNENLIYSNVSVSGFLDRSAATAANIPYYILYASTLGDTGPKLNNFKISNLFVKDSLVGGLQDKGIRITNFQLGTDAIFENVKGIISPIRISKPYDSNGKRFNFINSDISGLVLDDVTVANDYLNVFDVNKYNGKVGTDYKNLLLNSRFDYWNAGTSVAPDGWAGSGFSRIAGLHSNYAVQISTTGSSQSLRQYGLSTVLKPSTKYTVGFWRKVVSLTGASQAVVFGFQNNSAWHTNHVISVADADWVYDSFTFKTPSSLSELCGIVLGYQNAAGTAVTQIAEVSLYEGVFPRIWTPNYLDLLKYDPATRTAPLNIDQSGLTNDLLNLKQNGTSKAKISSNGNLDIAGSFGAAIVSKTSNYTLADDFILLVDTTAGDVTLSTNVAASLLSGRVYKIKRTAGTNRIIFNPNGAETVDGNSTYDIEEAATIACNGTNWYVIEKTYRTSSATRDGILSSSDWTTFNNKQPAGSYLTSESDPLSLHTSGGTMAGNIAMGANVLDFGNGSLQNGGSDFTIMSKSGSGMWVSAATGEDIYLVPGGTELFATTDESQITGSATAGANGDVPSQVYGYIRVLINGNVKLIPIYNP